MSNKESKKEDIITVEDAYFLLGCSKATFYNKYRAKLNAVPTTDNRAWYRLNDIKKLKKESEKVKTIPPQYNVVKVKRD